MSDKSLPQSEIILYQTEAGRTRVQCRFENETLWLTQVQMAELFQTSVPNINLHLKAIYGEGELEEAAAIKSYLIVRAEGRREVIRKNQSKLTSWTAWSPSLPLPQTIQCHE